MQIAALQSLAASRVIVPRHNGMLGVGTLQWSIVRNGQPVSGFQAKAGDQIAVQIAGVNPNVQVATGTLSPDPTIMAGYADSSGNFKQVRTIGPNWPSSSFYEQWYAGGQGFAAHSWAVINEPAQVCPGGSQGVSFGGLLGLGGVVSMSGSLYLVTAYGLFAFDAAAYAAGPYSKTPYNVVNPATKIQSALPILGTVHPDGFPYLSAANASGYTMDLDLSGGLVYDRCATQPAANLESESVNVDRSGACQAEGGTYTDGQCFLPGSPEYAAAGGNNAGAVAPQITPTHIAIGAAALLLLLRGAL